MRSRINLLSLVPATLFLCLNFSLKLPLIPTDISNVLAQEPTANDQKSKRIEQIEQLLEEGVEAANKKVFPEALQKFEQALAISKEIGDRQREESALRNMAVVYRRSGEYNRALELFDRAFGINREPGILISMGNIYLKLGDREKGIEFYQQAFEINRNEYILTSIGNIYLESGDREKGIEFYQQAFEMKGDPDILNYIEKIYLEASEYEPAIEFYQKALAIYRESKICYLQSELLNKIGKIYEIQGQNERAREFYQQATEVLEDINQQCEELTFNTSGFSEGIVLRDDDDQPRQRPRQASQDK